MTLCKNIHQVFVNIRNKYILYIQNVFLSRIEGCYFFLFHGSDLEVAIVSKFFLVVHTHHNGRKYNRNKTSFSNTIVPYYDL